MHMSMVEVEGRGKPCHISVKADQGIGARAGASPAT
jgi:hypothetical protein